MNKTMVPENYRPKMSSGSPSPYAGRDFTVCDVCGVDLPIDSMHVMIDNGYLIRNVFCCRKHRYVTVLYNNKEFVQERTDRELERLAQKFRSGELQVGWE